MMMMMNFFMSRRTTATCFALLMVLLVASLAVEVSSTNVKNGMGNTNTMPEDEKDEKRKLTGEDDTLTYTKTYIAVTKAADFVRLFSNGGNIVSFLDDFITKALASSTFKSNPEFTIQGSSTTQKGAVFATDSIEVVNAPDGVEVEVSSSGSSFQYQFAGNRKIKFTPVDDPFYFLHGQCVATSGFLEPSMEIPTVSGPTTVPQPVITSQLCKLNLCLGGRGASCIAIYSGSAYVFNFGKGVALNNGAEFATDDFIPSTFEAPPLPPPFPGTIIGGTGAFEGIEGSVSIATIAGTTGPILFTDGTGSTFDRTTPVGSIVQVILVKSNMPLPPGP